MLSHRFNSSKELVEDVVKNAVEQHKCDVINKFNDMDKMQTGMVTEEDFRTVLLSLCGDLSSQELKALTMRYSSNGGGVSWKKFIAKTCPQKVVRHSSDVIVHHEYDDQ